MRVCKECWENFLPFLCGNYSRSPVLHKKNIHFILKNSAVLILPVFSIVLLEISLRATHTSKLKPSTKIAFAYNETIINYK